MRASLSAPGVFAPVDLDGRMLVDGGLSSNLPVDVAREMGVDVLIVVDCGFPLLERNKLESVATVSNQMLAILIRQPDVGQTGLLLCLWGAMLFFWGMSFVWVGAGLGIAGALGLMAYEIFPHVHHRVDQYLSESDTGYQAGLALKAFAHGGFAGVGPGAGTIKYRIPDAHSDFIFAVAGEEFGFVLCGLIALLFCVLTVRLLLRSAAAREPFAQLAGAGLAVVTARASDAVLARRRGAALERALLGIAPRALEEELHALPAAEAADGSVVLGHLGGPRRDAAWAGGIRYAGWG